MSDSKNQNLKSWDTLRARGKWSFILIKGVLFWGGSMFVIMGLFLPSLTHSPNALTPRLLIANAVIWPLGGLLWGVTVWWLMERKYNKAQRLQDNNAP